MNPVNLRPVPASIARLVELAYNMWWSWQPEAQALFQSIDTDLWEEVGHNPVRFLTQVAPEKLDAASTDPDYLARFEHILQALDAYLKSNDTWFARTYPHLAGQGRLIAYFSAEFGLHEALPIYSGGLGILSGDHIKEASDLDLPFVGVGFLYPQGYFQQEIDSEGRQGAIYEKLDFAAVAARPALDRDGHEVMISVELPGRTVYARVWHIQVGRVPLFLLDTDVEANAPADRELSARLYGGDQEMRISQEIMLGIGGVRALRALGCRPLAWHMNEGHSAFLGLELARELVQDRGLGFDQARQVVMGSSIFTTHTPVPAGNDAFPFSLVERYFHHFWPRLGLSREAFLNIAREDKPWGSMFSMTILALRMSGQHNGVSEIHGDVARKMWHFLWPNAPVDAVPIGYVTNGVHSDTWLAPQMAALYDRYLGVGWRERLDDRAIWARLADIPDETLWETRVALRHRMVDFVRQRERKRRTRLGRPAQLVAEADTLLDPNALTIGFARRFATYKRATLIFSDLERLRRLLQNPERPVQIVFAGKAHPADDPGKWFIQHVYGVSQLPEFRGRIVFVEDYDMDAARHLVQGVDVWLNNPRRPLEASGTSGQKASLNGVPNLSVLDGWWYEAYDGHNGWSIRDLHGDQGNEDQDWGDALALYDRLEKEIVPLFYDRDPGGVPHGWLGIVRAAVGTIAPEFSTRRMVKEYTHEMYVAAMRLAAVLSADDYAVARKLPEWKLRVERAWPAVQVEGVDMPNGSSPVGLPAGVTARLRLGELKPDEVRVEVRPAGTDRAARGSHEPVVLRFADIAESGAIVYRGEIPVAGRAGAYTLRVVPRYPELDLEDGLGLMKSWP